MKRLNLTAIICVIIFSGISRHLYAASPGSLDPSFGVSGFVKTNILGNDRLTDIAFQPDGKIVAVGGSNVTDFTIVRYTANGVLDTTFSGDGIAFVDFGGNTDLAREVQIQGDGKILVSGFVSSASGSTGISGIARLNENGSLDTTFDTDGKLTIANFSTEGLEIQTDGKIVLGGSRFLTNTDFAVIRLNPNGSFDSSFDSDGIVTTNIEAEDRLAQIKIQSDGKIVAAGNAVSGIAKSTVVRYNPNGSLDTSFSGDGIVLNDFSAAFEPTSGLSIDSTSGAITTIGSNFSPNTMLIVRYTATGNLDNSFSDDGILQISTPLLGGTDVIQQSDRKIICSGHNGGSILDDVHLVRINLNGTIDTSFGNNGFVNLRDGGGGSAERSLALVGDKLLIGNNANSFTDFGVERINLSVTPSQSGDFDGDGFTDIAVYRPSQGLWIRLNSSNNTVIFNQFGLNGDIPIDGDFDGDGRNDLAIYRPSEGLWFVEKSSDGSNFARQFGTGTDKPVTDDYDKDGKADLAFFRPSSGEWFVIRSSDGFNSFFSFPFGSNGDIPIVKKGP
jgi:uncharacterized delta-60 repeat protein